MKKCRLGSSSFLVRCVHHNAVRIRRFILQIVNDLKKHRQPCWRVRLTTEFADAVTPCAELRYASSALSVGYSVGYSMFPPDS